MARDLLNTYKYGWKTSYYQNTMDGKTDEVEIVDENSAMNEYIPPMIDTAGGDEEDCEICRRYN